MKANNRRSYILIGLIATFFLLAWQVYRLISTDLTSTTAGMQSHTKQAQSKATQAVAPKPAEWSREVKGTPAENSYLKLAAKIQKAKMQLQLLKQRVSIAQAEKKLSLSHHHGSSLLSTAVGHGQAWSGSDNSDVRLNLVFLAKIANGEWEATLQRDGKYLHVRRDNPLGNGRHVAAIIKNGVWIQDAQGVHWLGFAGEPAPTGIAASTNGKKERVIAYQEHRMVPVLVRSSHPRIKPKRPGHPAHPRMPLKKPRRAVPGPQRPPVRPLIKKDMHNKILSVDTTSKLAVQAVA